MYIISIHMFYVFVTLLFCLCVLPFSSIIEKITHLSYIKLLKQGGK